MKLELNKKYRSQDIFEYLEVGMEVWVNYPGYDSIRTGKIYEINGHCIQIEGYGITTLTDDYAKYIKILKFNKNKSMNLVEKFKASRVKEPAKTFRETGITDNTDTLTEEGQALFLQWLFEKNQDDFKKEVADNLLEDKEEEEK